MKRLCVSAIFAGAMFFSVASANAQVYENQEETMEQIQQESEYKKVEEKDLANEVRQAVERDYEGATLSEIYSKEKDGKTTYKLVVNAKEGEPLELYADAQGNWIEDKEKDSK